MNETQHELLELETICRQQYEEIEKKKLLLLDMEEENRVLRHRVDNDQKIIEKHVNRVNELERWCTHLQGIIDKEAEEKQQREAKYQLLEKRLGIFFRIARKIKRMLVG